jgi:quercetin dioxygenase-like cupin family protein
MTVAPREIVNPRTGQRMRFLLTGEDTGGALLRLETVNPPTGLPEPVHVHPHQETRAEMSSGTLRFVVDGAERRIGPGESITIPAGVPHHFVNDGDEDAVAIQEARPALRTAEFFITYFAMAARGELDEHGRPSLLRSALLGPRFADEIRLVTPPWPVQRLAYGLLAPRARLRGLSV